MRIRSSLSVLVRAEESSHIAPSTAPSQFADRPARRSLEGSGGSALMGGTHAVSWRAGVESGKAIDLLYRIFLIYNHSRTCKELERLS
jgi:hypothetical protein